MTERKATVLAVSTDDLETMKKFKAELKAQYAFVADPDAKLVKLFDTKMPVMNIASRTTFVIGPERRVVSVQTGGDALEPEGAIKACALRPAAAADAGASAVKK